ncbi:hypothetical protein [Streptomyces sp. NPDC005805]|uniref:hypothetical protein n=1 Tax=Streptomyces sp. NPDC005805 TaxID=3157068 RepID=UPI0033F760B3
MHDLIAAPFGDRHLILRRGSSRAIRVGSARFADLADAVSARLPVPAWLTDAARRAWERHRRAAAQVPDA